MSLFKKLNATKRFKYLIEDFNNLSSKISSDFRPIYDVYYHYTSDYIEKNKFTITPENICETFLKLADDFNDLYNLYLVIYDTYHTNIKYLFRKYNAVFSKVTYRFSNYRKQIEQLMYDFRLLARENEEHKKFLIANHLISLHHHYDTILVKLLPKVEYHSELY